MLGDMLRALSVNLNNEQLQNAIAEVTEEDIRQKRLQFYLQLVKKAFNARRLPPPFDHRAFISQTLDFNNTELHPFYPNVAVDFRPAETFWEDDGDKNEQFEQGIWETVGANEVTIGLDDFVRILVNYRKVHAPGFSALQ